MYKKLITATIFVFFFGIVQAQINMIVKPDGFLFLEGKDSICFYQKAPKSKDGVYLRCNYIHPLYGIDGNRLTEDFPADQLHQRGVFWAWHQILINGKAVSDGWDLKNFQQQVVDVEFRKQKEGGVLKTVDEWKSPLWEDGTKAYLKEETKIMMRPKVNRYRRIDIEIKLKALTDRLSIGGSDDEKGYGGFSVRLIQPDDITFHGEGGMIEPLETAIKAGNFMNISGSFLRNGKKGGLVIWSSSDNPKPNDIWILRKKASMQNAVYPGQQPVPIPFDEPLLLKYSLIVYDGEMTNRQIQKIMK